MSIQSEPNNSQQSVPAANWLAEGDAHYQERRYKDALNCYTQLVIAAPQNAVAWQKKAQAMVMSLKYAEAVETCAIALKLDPQNASIWF
jgi:tetratricopeptide (TPR) repeat protein